MINWFGAILIAALVLVPAIHAAHAKGWGRSGHGHYASTSRSAASHVSHSYRYR